MKPALHAFDAAAEFDTAERCFIVELANTSDDPDVSIARARVAPVSRRAGIGCAASRNAT